MFGYLNTVCLAIVLLSYSEGSNISDQRLCYDPKCNEPLSRARTLLKYVKNYDGGLSFLPGTEVVIYSKSAGSNLELWGAEVGGKRGYIPKKMVQEYHVYHPESTLKHIVPTAESNEPAKGKALEEERKLETTQNKLMDMSVDDKPAILNSESSFTTEYDVVDGTTIYDDALGTPTLNPLDTITKSTVPIESTTSFIATANDMSTVAMTQSDMAPISPTTMMGKTEEPEAVEEAVGKTTEEVAGVVKSVFNIMSELVSGGEQSNNDIVTTQDVHVKDDAVVVKNALLGDTLKLGDKDKLDGSDKVDDLSLKTTDLTDDEDEEDDTEDEDDEEVDDEDDGYEDDEEEVEPIDNPKEDENALDEIAKYSTELKSDFLPSGERGNLDIPIPPKEWSNEAPTHSNPQPLVGDTASTLSSDKDKEGGNLDIAIPTKELSNEAPTHSNPQPLVGDTASTLSSDKDKEGGNLDIAIPIKEWSNEASTHSNPQPLVGDTASTLSSDKGKEGGNLDIAIPTKEWSNEAPTHSNPQHLGGDTVSTLSSDKDRVYSEMETGNKDSSGEAIPSYHDSFSSKEKEVTSESSENHTKSDKSHDSDKKSDSSTVGLESGQHLGDIKNSDSKVDTDRALTESKLTNVSDGFTERQESNVEPSTVSPKTLGEEKLESLISGDQSITLKLSDPASEIITESPAENSNSTVVDSGDQRDPDAQTEASNVVSDGYNFHPDQSSNKLEQKEESAYTSESIAAAESQYEKPTGQIEPSNLGGDEYIANSGPVDMNAMKAEKTVEMVEEPLSELTLEKDQRNEPDQSLGSNEAETSKDYLDDETLNVSETENAMPSPEETSPGIFSVVLHSLGSGYGFVSSMIFGSGDERFEVVEGQESSTQGVSQIMSGKYSDSENNIYQQSPVKDAQGLAADGESVFGRSVNSYCEGSSEINCVEQSSAMKSEAKSSNSGDQSEENPELSSWMAFSNFAIGNDSNGMFSINVPSYGAMIYSIITGIIVLCFFLGHYFIEGNRRDVVLLAKINTLEKELTVSSKECLILKEKLKQFEIKSSDFDDSAEVIYAMKNELEKVQSEKAQLEKELEATTEAGLEMEHMVSQFLSSQQDSKSLMESIEQLQMQANKQQAKISSLENSLITKTQENEKLAQELGVTESKVQELEEDLKQVSENLNQRDEEHSKRCAELKEWSEIQHNKYLEDVKNKTIENEMAHTRCKSLEATITEMKETLAIKENEICVLQECLQQLKISNGDDPDKAEDQLKNILDFGKLKAELLAVIKERDSLKEKLQGEEDARRLLEDHVKVIREEVEKLRKCHEAAEREKVEAQTRLEVLSSYFKEKESQLQKELGNKEALWMQKHTDASTIMQRMKSLEEEVENYKKEDANSKTNVSERVTLIESREITITHPVKERKDDILTKHDDLIGSATEKLAKETFGEPQEKKGSQTETLKKEILDQERGYKAQLATFEKKAHENWVAARQAERKLEESKQEASQLRNRLTMADKTHPASTSQNGDESKPNLSMIDSNGELSASPLHLGLASNSSVDMLLSDPHSHYLDPNSSPPHVGGGSRLPPPPLLPPPPFPPLPLPPRSPYHHPLSPPLPFMPLPPPDANLYHTSSIDGHRPPPLGRMSSPPPAPSPSQSPHLPPNDSRGGEFPSPYHDRGGGGRSSSPSGLYMPPDDRSLGEEWRRYCTPPPHHPSHSSDYPIHPYPTRPHWEDEPPHPTSSFRPLPSSQRTESHRELKGGRSKGSHSSESEVLDKSSRHGGKL